MKRDEGSGHPDIRKQHLNCVQVELSVLGRHREEGVVTKEAVVKKYLGT